MLADEIISYWDANRPPDKVCCETTEATYCCCYCYCYCCCYCYCYCQWHCYAYSISTGIATATATATAIDVAIAIDDTTLFLVFFYCYCYCYCYCNATATTTATATATTTTTTTVTLCFSLHWCHQSYWWPQRSRKKNSTKTKPVSVDKPRWERRPNEPNRCRATGAESNSSFIRDGNDGAFSGAAPVSSRFFTPLPFWDTIL